MLALNEIHFGDCLKLMESIPDQSVDMVLCDLPYGITANKWDSPIDLPSLWSAYNRICKGPVVLTASQPFTSALVMSNVENFRHEWVWLKNRGSNFANVKREPMKEHESVLVFSNSHWTYNRQMQERTGGGASRAKYSFKPDDTEREGLGSFSGVGRRRITKLRVPSSWQKFNVEVGLHPTQKPVGLFAYLIRTYTNEGGVVLDNTCGSGTTAIACIREKRKYICIDNQKAYVESARKRVVGELSSIE